LLVITGVIVIGLIIYVVIAFVLKR
jgi:hypothetical protein